MLVASNMRIFSPIETENIFCRVIFDISIFASVFCRKTGSRLQSDITTRRRTPSSFGNVFSVTCLFPEVQASFRAYFSFSRFLLFPLAQGSIITT